MVVFTDASHANLCDGVGSTADYCVMLVSPHRRFCAIDWATNKIKRVVRSSLAAEAMALQIGIGACLYLRVVFLELTGVRIPIRIYVDSQDLMDALHSTKRVDDKVLRIDVAWMKQVIAQKRS